VVWQALNGDQEAFEVLVSR